MTMSLNVYVQYRLYYFSPLYTGGGSGDTGGFWPDPYGRLNSEWRRRASVQEKSCSLYLVAALIAHPTPCSDFRLASHVSH